jgi:hypothetical protein
VRWSHTFSFDRSAAVIREAIQRCVFTMGGKLCAMSSLTDRASILFVPLGYVAGLANRALDILQGSRPAPAGAGVAADGDAPDGSRPRRCYDVASLEWELIVELAQKDPKLAPTRIFHG